MSETVIKVDNVSKQYRLGTVGTGTLSHDLNRWWHKTRGKEDPYLKIGDVNDRSTKASSDYVWALKNIDFEVQQGEVLGIIGKNGAGKSTLLKILSQVTGPTTGSIKAKGRIASLLEVGTGFHGELTGRENIFLNGTILGMTKKEVQSQLDEIVDFSGVERYLDTPVKRYSSGMMVRLGFAVAAHLDPEILVVDEVLAVGDAEFQKKAIGKMKDVSKGQGRTVLFVSHNMASIKSLCTSGLVLDNGSISFRGSSKDSVANYLNNFNNNALESRLDSIEMDGLKLKSLKINSSDFSLEHQMIDEYSALEVILDFEYFKNINRLRFNYVLMNDLEQPLFTFSSAQGNPNYSLGTNKVTCLIPKGFLNVGRYYISLYVISDSKTTLAVLRNVLTFEIVLGTRELGDWMQKEPGFIKPKFNWIHETH